MSIEDFVDKVEEVYPNKLIRVTGDPQEDTYRLYKETGRQEVIQWMKRYCQELNEN
ncbi:MAG: hypothetical protein GWN86_06235 [Desulfobacterales bacterium]|nr:hypothetical protein [Desulfobacterales bacterium]